ETSYIALLGMFIVVALGIILGLRFWLDPESGFEGGFTVPWNTIFIVSIISYVFTFLCTIGPSRGAAKITPAEALRYVG
ncbi:MAG: ABC transporter permease, partial [Thermoplasmata archaeon]|nr:ABC transporter permease [Thermoplasmata archaeon]